MHLNARAARLCDKLAADADALRTRVVRLDCGATLIDCGVEAPGGIAAGVMLARVCLADLAAVTIQSVGDRPAVVVQTDHPRLACMASQYAGWEVKHDGYFAMGSGPMRARAAREALFETLAYRETASEAVGVLETSKLPGDAVCRDIAEKCGVAADRLTLLAAPTRSLAGTLQIVARSVETAMHKLHELEFDLARVESGWGCAPLPPPAAEDFAAIGRTNDAILYGGRAELYVRGDDASLEAVGPQVPSSASRDYGRPFAQVLAAYEHDFYKVDPLLFSPAVATFHNLDTGNSFTFGGVDDGVLRASFAES